EQEEELIPVLVELVRDENRPAEVIAELVVLERLRFAVQRRERRIVARPGVGVHRAVAEELIRRAVEIARAALGDNADLPAARAPVFRSVRGRQDLYFLRGIHICGPDRCAVRTRTSGYRAV